MMREQTYPNHYFLYNGINSAEYGIFISGISTYATPERDISVVSVPGRNGSVIFDNNRYTDVDITISCFIPRDFVKKFDDFKAAILTDVDYHRFETTYDPECFRYAYVTGPIIPVTGALNRSGHFDITFHCKPQRFLKVGERTIDITVSGDTIHNRTTTISKPRIQIKGTGTVRFRGAGITEPRQIFDVSVNQTTETGVIFLDSETGNAYYETVDSDGFRQNVSVNHWISTGLSGFPMIRPGSNFVYLNGDVEWVRILPRWWTL